jgi:murein DD-endopeptidase MepM/ murein hydrolase activator NlpD
MAARVYWMRCVVVTCTLLAATAQAFVAVARGATEPADATVTVAHPIARGESVAAVLQRYGVALDERVAALGAVPSAINLNHVEPGRYLTLTFDTTRALSALRYDLDEDQWLVVAQRDGVWAGKLERAPVRIEVIGARGTIQTTFHRAARDAGIPDPIISRMVDLLSGEIDFDADVRVGDRFRVLYERRSRMNGTPLPPGNIVAADFVGSARSAAAFVYPDSAADNAEPRYVDRNGRPLEHTLLRYPVEFTRISSAFSEARFHPILKHNRPHLGVDFAAPAGTPVRAIGAGIVACAAWKGGFGRHVEVDHGDGLVSTYSHLRAVHPALAIGTRVKQGQLLGWVGQTGSATGPHLHFALFENGQYLDPLSLHRSPLTEPIDRQRFAVVRAALMRQLRAIPGSYAAVSSTAPVAFSALAQARLHSVVVLTL